MQTKTAGRNIVNRTKWSCPQCRMDCPVRLDPNPQLCPTCRFLEIGELPSTSLDLSERPNLISRAAKSNPNAEPSFRLVIGACIAVMAPAILLTIVAMFYRHGDEISKPATSHQASAETQN